MTKAEYRLLAEIVRRAVRFCIQYNLPANGQHIRNAILECHLNAQPLDLAALIGADDATFTHDVFGIQRHFDPDTNKLTECFLPRCHAR